MLDRTPERMAETMPEHVPERMSDIIRINMQKNPDGMLETMSDTVCQGWDHSKKVI